MPAMLFFVAQGMRPWESDNTKSELLVMASMGDEVAAIGLSRLAVHTTVRPGMLWYHMLRYKLVLEPSGEKKPSAKSPPLETSVSPEESGFASVSWSSDLQDELKNRRMKMGTQEGIPMVPLLLSGRSYRS
jgi:hypothetical protein